MAPAAAHQLRRSSRLSKPCWPRTDSKHHRVEVIQGNALSAFRPEREKAAVLVKQSSCEPLTSTTLTADRLFYPYALCVREQITICQSK